ncbi:hypothetical protein ADK43_02525 [Streptomyces rimosus subsp. rimosus]|nr:hypothetical protein ADK43_02525 [Streptomyces rimosus subsp. rimosus]
MLLAQPLRELMMHRHDAAESVGSAGNFERSAQLRGRLDQMMATSLEMRERAAQMCHRAIAMRSEGPRRAAWPRLVTCGRPRRG